MKILNSILALVVMAIAGGCTSSALLRDPGALIGRPRMEKQVARILCLWEPSQGVGIDGKPARGFSGQLLFFAPGSPAAARVGGRIRIHEFDNYDAEEDNPQPLHSFDFDPEAWDVHRTEGSLGHSYSVFIPYMQKHKDPVRCALKVEFLGENGQITASDMTEVLLPGKTAMATTAPFTRNIARQGTRKAGDTFGSRQAENPGAETPVRSTMRTETIPLPRTRTTHSESL